MALAFACGCEFITGGLDSAAGGTDTESPVDVDADESTGSVEPGGTSTGPVTSASATATGNGSGSGTGGTSSDTADHPPAGTDGGGVESSTGNERDAAEGTSGVGESTGAIETANVGSCCEPGDGVGCMDPGIEACVCAIDSWCCDVQWDQVCVDLVEDGGCASCNVGPLMEEDTSCCSAHDTPGCDADEVAECVCATDGFCCSVFWDDVCVTEVEKLGCGPCEGDDVMMMMGAESTGPATTGSTGG